ncbi:MAG: class I SAM-dependent methyltransferase [Thermoleophilia bacterium]
MMGRDCPVCGLREPELVYRQRFAVEDDGRRITGYEVVCCQGCGAVYADGVPSQESLDDYYAVASKYEYLERGGEAPAALGESHRDMVERLRALLPDPASRIVDVGCGNGDVLGLLRRAGYTNLLGVDPAEHSAAAARRLHEVEVVRGSVLSMPPGAAQSGCIVLSAVLEHVREVAAALREVSGMLAADGLLYVEVPDLERFARYESVPFQQFSVEHINYFTSGSLARAAAGAGLRLARTWRALRHTGTTPEPVVCSVFTLAGKVPLPATRDRFGPRAARRYVVQSEVAEAEERAGLERLTAAGTPLIVWGAGTHMQHLLARPPLAGATIVAIVDANPRLQGVVVAGLTVAGPESIAGRGEAILVGSPAHEQEIIDMARRDYGLRNEFVSLVRPTTPGPQTA